MNKRHILESIFLALILTGLSYILGIQMNWITQLNWLEVFAVFTSYVCTWLCTRQSRWNYPVGIITTAAYSLLFFQWGMPALAIFNMYLVGSLIYGWFRWGPDNITRKVTNVEPKWYIGYLGLGLLVTGFFILVNTVFNPGIPMNIIDVGLAGASGVAQFMLDNKKLQTWILWFTVNVISIPFFLYSGLTLVAFQYIFFLINSIYAYIEWKKSMTI